MALHCIYTVLYTDNHLNSELKNQKVDWFKNGYFESADTFLPPVVDTVPRIDSRTLTCEEFRSKYELPRIPIVLTHAMDEWPTMKKWTIKVCSVLYQVFHIRY